MPELMYVVKCGDEDAYNVFYNNGKHMGLIYKEVDGYFVYLAMNQNGGFSDAAEFHWLADKLDELNQPWDEEITSYFEQERSKAQSQLGIEGW